MQGSIQIVWPFNGQDQPFEQQRNSNWISIFEKWIKLIQDHNQLKWIVYDSGPIKFKQVNSNWIQDQRNNFTIFKFWIAQLKLKFRNFQFWIFIESLWTCLQRYKAFEQDKNFYTVLTFKKETKNQKIKIISFYKNYETIQLKNLSDQTWF